MHLWIAQLPDLTQTGADELYERALRRVDSASQTKIAKFYRRPDAWRCLIGRLLPRQLLKRQGVADPRTIIFDATSAGKPFILHPITENGVIAYNVSHDNALIAMAYTLEAKDRMEIGVDVMHVGLPQGRNAMTASSFIEMLEDQLSPVELSTLRNKSSTPATVLSQIFWLWTIKEAYTKALGQGLGFDFSRISFHFDTDKIYVDGEVLRGYEFILFSVKVKGSGLYQGVVVRCIGGEQECSVIRKDVSMSGPNEEWVEVWEGEKLVESADDLQAV